MPRTKKELPGSFFPRNGRWWWGVKLPGEDRQVCRPLKSPGAEFATTDRAVAEEIARGMYQAALLRQVNNGTGFDGTIGSLVARYRRHADGYYRGVDGRHTSQVSKIHQATQPLLDLHATTPIEQFGPLALQEIRKQWEKEHLCRSTINARVRIIQAIFVWGVSQEIVPVTIKDSISSVQAIHKGRSEHGAKEPRKVRPADPDVVKMCLPFMPPMVRDMVETHMLTGMRSNELCWISPKYIDRSDPEAWLYRVPAEANKEEFLEEGDGKHARVVPLVGKVQQILSKYLLRNPESFCFNPNESAASYRQERRANRKTGLHADGSPSSNKGRDSQPKSRSYNARYDRNTYGTAVRRAVRRAMRTLNKDDKKAVAYWHPHMLRHTAATLVRRALGDCGRDAARALLGHKHLAVTDIYAEVDKDLAIQAAKRLA